MKMSKTTCLKSEQEAAALELANQKPEQVSKPVMRLDKDGKTRPHYVSLKKTEAQSKYEFWMAIKEVESGCWEWQKGFHGKTKLQSYGSLWWLGKRAKAHRKAFELINGEIPVGLCVCHTCDNPKCCNPNHLFLGTHKENIADCISKNRYRKEIGEDRYNAKLTEHDISEIRRRYQFRHPTNSGVALAREFGIVHSMVWSIVNNKKWKHVNPAAARAAGVLCPEGRYNDQSAIE